MSQDKLVPSQGVVDDMHSGAAFDFQALTPDLILDARC